MKVEWRSSSTAAGVECATCPTGLTITCRSSATISSGLSPPGSGRQTTIRLSHVIRSVVGSTTLLLNRLQLTVRQRLCCRLWPVSSTAPTAHRQCPNDLMNVNITQTMSTSVLVPVTLGSGACSSPFNP